MVQTTLAFFDPISFIAMLAIAGGLSLAARALNKPKTKRTTPDNKQYPQSNRGEYVPLLLGRRRLAPTFMRVGDRKAHTRTEGYVYTEQAAHVLCIGPAHALHGIYVQGQRIWPLIGGESIYRTGPDAVANGTEFTCRGEHGTFRIYWGDRNQPVNTELAALMGGIQSRWPYLTYIQWCPKHLGYAPQWPEIVYDIETRVQYAGLSNSASWLEDTGSGRHDFGPNPAHALWQLISAPYPHGAGVSPAYLDIAAFEELGEVLEAEHLPCHVLAAGGEEAVQKVGEILVDCGIALPQVARRLVPIALRALAAEDVIEIDDDALVPPDPEVVRAHDETTPDRVNFTFADISNAFRDQALSRPDDAMAISRRRPKEVPVPLPTVIARRIALKVANRRSLELMANGQVYRMDVTRGARRLRPGQGFSVPGIGALRVATIQLSGDTTKAKISAIVDPYTFEPSSHAPVWVDGSGVAADDLDPEPDVAVKVLVNPVPAGSATELWVLRARANAQVTGALVYVGTDGVTYGRYGRQVQAAAGGTLTATLAAAATDSDPAYPFTPFNTDIVDVLDLTGTGDWADGVQIAVIGSEICFLRNVTAVGAGYTLNGLIRGQLGTSAVEHAAGTQVFIIPRASLSGITGPLIKPGRTLYIKTRPYSFDVYVDLSAVTAVTVNT